MVKETKALILRVEGTNCDADLANAFRLAGAETDLVHANELIKGLKSLEDYQILGVPGGFAHGDNIAAGKIMANIIRYQLKDAFRQFIDAGKPVLGICNGFQALVKAGLLPDLEGSWKQEATLGLNDSGKFIDGWFEIEAQESICSFGKGFGKSLVPINHGEGKFIAGKQILEKLAENKQITFTYPKNPNGSMMDIAGICNIQGNVMGMMPHPEKFVSKYQHPYWTRMGDRLPEEGAGLKIFRNVVDYARRL